MIREKEDNCVTRQEVLVENLNEFKGQSKVELFSEKINLIFLLSAVCVPVSNSVSVSIFCHFFFVVFVFGQVNISNISNITDSISNNQI